MGRGGGVGEHAPPDPEQFQREMGAQEGEYNWLGIAGYAATTSPRTLVTAAPHLCMLKMLRIGGQVQNTPQNPKKYF